MIIIRFLKYILSLMRVFRIILNDKIKIESILNTRIEKNVSFRCVKGKMNIGRKVIISSESSIESFGGEVYIGDNTFLNSNVKIVSMKSIKIGKNCMLAPRVMLYDHDHKFQDTSKLIMNQGYNISEIIIEDDVWIGANSILTKGVRVGKHSVIGANSVVTKDVPAFTVVAGNPAKIIKKIK